MRINFLPSGMNRSRSIFEPGIVIESDEIIEISRILAKLRRPTLDAAIGAREPYDVLAVGGIGDMFDTSKCQNFSPKPQIYPSKWRMVRPIRQFVQVFSRVGEALLFER